MKIYTDGACRGNGKETSRGAWAFVVVDENEEIIHQASEAIKNTTNNIMEITAAIQALQWLSTQEIIKTQSPIVASDSQYVIKGITEWIHGWKFKNWKATTGPVKNVELWKHLDILNANVKPMWMWVRGHDGNQFNEVADSLCNQALDKLK